MVDAARLRSGDLLITTEGVRVFLSEVIPVGEGGYRAVDPGSEVNLRPGAILVFIATLSAEQIVVLAEGTLGWVFVDEVDLAA